MGELAGEPSTGPIMVIGAGAVGSYLGGVLAATGREVWLLGRRGGMAVSPERLVLERHEAPETVLIHRIGNPAAGPAHVALIILAVKVFDLEGALASASRWPDAPLLTVQNGIGAEAAAITARTSPLLAGSLTTAVELVEGGVAARRKGGLGLAGIRDADAVLLRNLAAAFTAGGLPTRVFADATAMKWSKLLANLLANATSALLDMEPGAVYADKYGFDLERRQLLEAIAVMRRDRHAPVMLPGAHVGLLLIGLRLPSWIARPIMSRAVGAARGGKPPSLHGRLRGGGDGPTEAPWLNGAVVEAGQRLGIPVPVNTGLAVLVAAAAADPAILDDYTCRPDRLRDAVFEAAAETAVAQTATQLR
jgi:2-dehydropantoate 2-reductase